MIRQPDVLIPRCHGLPPGAPCPVPEDCDCDKLGVAMKHYSGSFFWPVVVILATIGFLILGLLWFAYDAFGADVDQTPCLTKEQARIKYPGAWLYWHTANRCWDNRKGGGATYTVSRAATWGKQNSLKLAKPNLDANGNVMHHSGRAIILDPPAGPNIFYPSLIAGGGTVDQMLTPEAMNTWPLIADFDVEPPQFIPWQKRVAAIFDVKP